MLNKDALISTCNELELDLEVLSYNDIIDGNYVDAEELDFEDFCGCEMSEDETCFWIVTSEPYFTFVKNDEDLDDRQISNILLYLSTTYQREYSYDDIKNCFEKHKNK